MASIQQLANNLKFLRTITGRTQDDLAAYLNISRQAYSTMRHPSGRLIRILCCAFLLCITSPLMYFWGST